MFGEPEQASEAFQKAGINYFLFSKEFVSADPLMKSPLLDPDHIGRYLGIRWTDGTTALLTWLTPDMQPFEGDWIDSYRKAASSRAVSRFSQRHFRGLARHAAPVARGHDPVVAVRPALDRTSKSFPPSPNKKALGQCRAAT